MRIAYALHIIGFQCERSQFAREITTRRPGGMPDVARLRLGRAGGMVEAARLRVGRAGGMEKAGRLRAERGGGMENVGCLRAGRAEGMVEAACLRAERGGGMVEAGRLGVRRGGGMGYVPHVCRPNLRMIVDVPHCLIIRPLRGRPKGRMPYAPTRTTTD